MKALVVSDTHGHPRLEPLLALAMECDLVLHLGDGFDDAQKLAVICPVPVVQVAGNHDHPFTMIPEKMVALGRFETLLTHGHLYLAKRGTELLHRRAVALGASVVLYGHLHRKRYEVRDGVHLFCPGSAWRNYDGSPPSVGLLEVQGPQLSTRWVELPPIGE